MDGKWYALDSAEVIAKLNTSGERGLDYGEASRRLASLGPNLLETAPGTGPWLLFLGQFRDFMVLVLLAATATSLLLGEVADGLTILIIVLLNAFMGFVQESRAERSLEALSLLSAPEARVVREGRPDRFPALDLVPGDIVLLEAGDIVPADIRLLESAGLETMEAVLTGESTPTGKDACKKAAEGAALGDVACALYGGTVVTRGRARGVVVETGMRTEMGQIAAMISGARLEATPLQSRLAKLGQALLIVSLFVCALVVVVGVARGEQVYHMFITGVSLAVAAIPEGLPAVVTVALALGVQRMAAKNAIIRRLPAVETLGCATVICSDKTGTLTENRMTVREGYIGGVRFVVEGEDAAPVQTGAAPVDLALFLRIAVGCNNGSLERVHVPAGRFVKRVTGQKIVQWRVSGDPTEGALLVLAARAGLTREDAREIKVAEFPFESERKRMSVVYRRGGRLFLYAKGAPDVLLSHCTHYLKDGRVLPLTGEARKAFDAQTAALARQAMRVLALAYREIPGVSSVPDAATAENGLILAGLAGLMDPPRPEAAQAIRVCRRAGIRVVMITGDHPATALAVARELGLAADGVWTGQELDGLSDSALADVVRKTSVFARVSPGHKLRIVRAFKKIGHVVAMTGDGVNDGPAVKEADIGIAMGKGGTDVTREASAMVLADDNFSTIVAAVEEGRAIYENIRKFIRYLLTCNTGEVLLMLAATLAGLPLPLLPIQILWVNLITDGLPAMALGVDPPADGLMTRPPRPRQESILARGLGRRILGGGAAIGLGTLFVFAAAEAAGLGLDTARTMAFNTLVFFQLFYVFNCRSEEVGPFSAGLLANPLLVGAVLLCACLQLSVTYVPWLAVIFHSVALSPGQMSVSLGMAASPLGVGLLARLWQVVRPQRRTTCLKF